MAKRLTLYILAGMILGVIVGYLVRVMVPEGSQAMLSMTACLLVTTYIIGE